MKLGSKYFEEVNFDKFVASYMSSEADRLQFRSGPIQIYPLQMATYFIKVPSPLFRTEYNFLLLFSSGGGKQQVDTELLELSENDILFIREGHLNAIKEISPDTTGFYVHIDSSLLSGIFPDEDLLNRFTFSPKISVPFSTMSWLIKCCELLFEQRLVDIKSIEVQLSILKVLIQKLANSLPSRIVKPTRQSEITMRFRELVYYHAHKERNISFYSGKLAVTDNYLNRCVKNLTTKSVKQHLNEMVVAKSKILLNNTAKSISEIAYELNFSDPSYFARLFKQVTGMKPSAYKDSIMHDLSD
ncbi:AraC-type DNA-binding protein [Cyclobacterium xiamenense]|uniref:AraC-type DNA-binding protein n=1 Tax=Cyclobacterium xiamenense TaxID=1297121 RepID=A0A1H6ZXA6_9BACT|nr:helix-turn-helix domain-containing protein [Cyclobacterium xiamenense]SEJ57981.1 AraC-type DNA-binding protein [Cyclobacterium xiamenense]